MKVKVSWQGYYGPGLQSALGLMSCMVRKPWLQRRVILDGVSKVWEENKPASSLNNEIGFCMTNSVFRKRCFLFMWWDIAI